MKLSFKLLFLGVLFSFSANAQVLGTVVEVLSGDTYVVDIKQDSIHSSKQVVKLFGVKSPVLEGVSQNQPYAVEARDSMSFLVGKLVQLTSKFVDTHNTPYCEVLFERNKGVMLLNFYVLSKGFGMFDADGISTRSIDYEMYKSSYLSAKKNNLGIWKGSPIDPFKWKTEHQN